MNLDRRRLLGLLGGVAVGGAGASALSSRSGASAGVTFAASDLTVRTDDGSLDSLTVAPAGTVSWSGLETPAGGVALTLSAAYGGRSFRDLASQRLPAAGLHGEADYAFESRDLLGVEEFDASDFAAADGERVTETVRLRLTVTVVAADGETTLTTGRADARFDVTVENRPEEGAVEGRANTGATDDGTTTAEPETTTETTDSGTTTAEPETTTETTDSGTTTAKTTTNETATESTTTTTADSGTTTTETTTTTTDTTTTTTDTTTTTGDTAATTADQSNTETVKTNTTTGKSNTNDFDGRDANGEE
ncbi:hypothetical protein [Halorussus salinus]|uniref:hypothetical protein n=1 Tax=Halorussus salinus TaxID=1364935 RepID=UPI00138EFA22|nr:hypothetical protein [Halorussus salinus]